MLPGSSRSQPTGVATITVLCAAGLFSAIQSTLVVPLLPFLPGIFGATPSATLWLVTITLLVGAVCTPIMSRIADAAGKRRIVIIAMVLSTVGSAVLAIEGNLALAIVGRALQGASAAVVPVAMSIMRDRLGPERVGFGVGLMSGTLGLGSAFGMPLAGLLYSRFGWTVLFLTTAALGVGVAVAVIRTIPESPAQAGTGFDWLGAVLLSAALTTVLLVISNGNVWGWLSPTVAVLAITAIGSSVLWVGHEFRSISPLVDLRTTLSKPVLLTNIASTLTAFTMYLNLLTTSQVLGLPAFTGIGLGLSPTEAGLALIPLGLVVAVVSPIGGALLNRFGGRAVLLGGAAGLTLGFCGRMVLTESVPQVLISSTFVNIGTALVLAAIPALIMSSVPIHQTASANGFNALTRMIGTSASGAYIAAVVSTFVLTVDGVTYPAPSAFHIIFWTGAVGGVLSFAMGTLVPKRSPEAVSALHR